MSVVLTFVVQETLTSQQVTQADLQKQQEQLQVTQADLQKQQEQLNDHRAVLAQQHSEQAEQFQKAYEEWQTEKVAAERQLQAETQALQQLQKEHERVVAEQQQVSS